MNRWIAPLLTTLLLLAPWTTTAEAAGPGLSAARPETVGLSAEKLAEIPKQMQAFVDDKTIAGAVTLVARDGRIVVLNAVGRARIEGDVPMQQDSLFAIASMTKPITATALMILQDEGKLSVDDPVEKYIPAFKKAALADGSAPSRPITIRDLLTHTSGLTGEQRCEETLEATAEQLAARPLAFQPGSKWSYSPGLNVCGRIIEVVSGKPYDVFLKERIFDPLGMTDTTFNPTEEQRARMAMIYKPDPEKGLAPDASWIVDDQGRRAPNPSGGLVSSAGDLFLFYQMILDGGRYRDRQIISPESVKQMTTIQTGDLTTGFTPGNGWGLGWCVVRQPQGVTEVLSPGTCGHGGAFGTQSWADPQRRMIFIMLIQRTRLANGDASPMREAFQRAATAAIIDEKKEQ